MQVDVADPEAGPSLRPRLLTGYCGEEPIEVEGVWSAGIVQPLRPRLARTVCGQLDAVTVGVGKVDGLVRAVVGGTLDRGLRRREPQRRVRELLARGIE